MPDEGFSGPFIITGLSGSGKTVLSRSLEDIGYLCVDNIPIGLVPELFATSNGEIERLVVVLDVRARGLVQEFPSVFSALEASHEHLRLIFVEASPEVLLRRFSVARRPHPLRDRNLSAAITDERRSLEPVRELADLIIDTTHLSPHELRREVLAMAGVEKGRQLLTVEVESFSYLRGVPATASLVFDVRFLPNPYFEPELRELAGNDEEVMTWLSDWEEVGEAVRRFSELVEYLVPLYERELKTHLSISVGCTGGRHRSVFVAERLKEALTTAGHQVSLHHRDKDRWRDS